tara:strand:+ start:71 stop:310 length:240 start_codon:yes stop_codon:yes gene_type:complete
MLKNRCKVETPLLYHRKFAAFLDCETLIIMSAQNMSKLVIKAATNLEMSKLKSIKFAFGKFLSHCLGEQSGCLEKIFEN